MSNREAVDTMRMQVRSRNPQVPSLPSQLCAPSALYRRHGSTDIEETTISWGLRLTFPLESLEGSSLLAHLFQIRKGHKLKAAAHVHLHLPVSSPQTCFLIVAHLRRHLRRRSQRQSQQRPDCTDAAATARSLIARRSIVSVFR